MVLRVKDPDRERGFRVPGGPFLLPILGVISCIGLAVYLPPTSWMRFVYWLLTGLVLYVVYGYRHSRLRNAAPIPVGGPSDFNPESQLPESAVRPKSDTTDRH